MTAGYGITSGWLTCPCQLGDSGLLVLPSDKTNKTTGRSCFARKNSTPADGRREAKKATSLGQGMDHSQLAMRLERRYLWRDNAFEWNTIIIFLIKFLVLQRHLQMLKYIVQSMRDVYRITTHKTSHFRF